MRMRLLICVCAALAAAVSCKSPVGRGEPGTSSLSLRFIVGGTAAPSSSSASRLILPTAMALRVKLIPADSAFAVRTQEAQIASGGSSVDLAFPQVAYGDYTVSAEALDSVGAVLFKQSATLEVPQSRSLSLALVPASYSQNLYADAPASNTLAGGASYVFRIPADQTNTGAFRMDLSGTDSGLLCYAQAADGADLSGDPALRAESVARGKPGADSYLTIYNPTAGPLDFYAKASKPACAVWARSADGGSGKSCLFKGAGTDASGNLYVAGYQMDASRYVYSGVAAAGSAAATNALLLKYGPDGKAHWAATTAGGSTGNLSYFLDAKIDGSGSVYAAGSLGEAGRYDFGNGASLDAGAKSSLLVKYSASGSALWARSCAVASGSVIDMRALRTAIGSDGVYIAGFFNAGAAGASLSFGDGVTLNAAYAGGYPFLAKYDGNGKALWARTGAFGADGGLCSFYGLAVDASDRVYVAGILSSAAGVDVGSGVLSSAEAMSGLVAEFDQAGTLAASSMDSFGDTACLMGLALDSAGALYVAGFRNSGGYTRAVLMKLSSASGLASPTWTALADSDASHPASRFDALGVSGSFVYAVGNQYGTGSYTYKSADGLSGGVASGGTNTAGGNLAMVRYGTADGAVQAAFSGGASNAAASYYEGACASGDSLYALGYWSGGASSIDLGSGLSASGADWSLNPLLVKYGF